MAAIAAEPGTSATTVFPETIAGAIASMKAKKDSAGATAITPCGSGIVKL